MADFMAGVNKLSIKEPYKSEQQKTEKSPVPSRVESMIHSFLGKELNSIEWASKLL